MSDWKIFDDRGTKRLTSKIDEDGVIRGKGKKAKIYRSFFLIYVDFKKGLFDICESGAFIKRQLTLSQFLKEIDDIQTIIRKKRRSNTRVRIYVSQIEVLLNLLKDYTIVLKHDTVMSESSRPTWARTDCFEICDFAVLRDSAPQSIDDMIKFFNIAFKDTYISKIKFSEAANSVMFFYRGLEQECHDDRNFCHRYIKSIDEWKDLRSGTTKGLHYAVDDFFGKILEGVTSFDKKSAYPSIFVSYDKFPIGEIHSTEVMKWKRFNRCIDGDKWFQIVFIDAPKVGCLDDLKIKAKDAMLAINNLDYTYLCKTGRKDEVLDALKKYRWRIYYTTKEGYLLDSFRKHIVDVYDEKEKSTDPEWRRYYKKQIDILYGKGVEMLQFESDDQVKQYYRDGKHYIMPHWSRLVVSKLRLDLLEAIEMIYEASGKIVAYNTDGLKIEKDCEKINNVFDELNREIVERNRAAGFDSDIGTWKKEYVADRFLQIDKVRYAYIVDGQLHTAVGGIPKNWFLDFLTSLDCDPLKWLMFPHLLEVPFGWKLDKSTKTYVPVIVKDFMYRPLTFDIQQGFYIK